MLKLHKTREHCTAQWRLMQTNSPTICEKIAWKKISNMAMVACVGLKRSTNFIPVLFLECWKENVDIIDSYPIITTS